MTTHLINELDLLKQRTFSLVAMVEKNLSLAVKAVSRRDETAARQAIENDAEIDKSEVSVEEECLKLLALYQPVAIDLRFIIAILKLTNDLERIGDLAVNIAERAIFLARAEPLPEPFDFDYMAGKATLMLKNSLDALINRDVELAAKVCDDDDEVDAINRSVYDQVKKSIKQHPQHLDSLINLLSVSRHLERIADHATNISEDVIYLVKGQIVRHAPDVPDNNRQENNIG
jgi:phosphate transport system protein